LRSGKSQWRYRAGFTPASPSIDCPIQGLPDHAGLTRQLDVDAPAQFLSRREFQKQTQRCERGIRQKEAQIRVEKKQKVAESLVQFLDLFFAGKYSFDKELFSITFQGKTLNRKIAKILSDGEKSIVSFCHYLAETHVLLTTNDDYKRLFFIIDDPISSLDFHFVYAVAQVIRNIGDYFELQGNARFIILTHNIEFMSILCRNKIVQQRFVLSSGKLGKLNEHLIMPYESHLKDIYAVARQDVQATHTTSNSIRHVLETICRFDAPRANLEDYFNEIEELKGNEFVYSLMHDGSHGAIRTDKPFSQEIIQRGCEAVIKFIDNKFQGQVEHVAIG
jgi:ABC-type lipopolysaccharide export system ATPase subunit